MGKPNIILPDFVRLSYVFDELCNLKIEHPEIFEDYSILGVHGQFDELNWHEKSRLNGNTSVVKHGVYFENEKQIFSKRKYSIFLDFSNPLLDDYNCYDRYGEKVLQSFENSNNGIVLSSMALLNRVKTDFPQYSACWKFFEIVSTADIVAKLNEVDYVLLPTLCAQDDSFIHAIPSQLRHKCIFVVNDACSAMCPNFTNHVKKSSDIARNIYDESFNGFCSIFYGRLTKEGRNSYSEKLSVDRISDILYPLGYEIFYIDSCSLSPYHFIYEITKFFIKDAYQIDVFKTLFDTFYIRNQLFMQQYRSWK